MPAEHLLTIENIAVAVSNLEKPFYSNGFTKGEVIDYYIRIAPVLLPHIADKPMTLKRYPHGADGKFFYQKQCPPGAPPWVDTVPIWSEHRNRHIDFCLINTLPTLIWASNLAVLELHPGLSRATTISCPLALVFDLDPGIGAGIIECAEVALLLRSLLATYELTAVVKTSGSKGLQLYIPLNTPCSYEQTKTFAHNIAKLLVTQRPDLVVANMRKNLRVGKVLIDWSQNDEHKTTVAVYSLRAKDKPLVSTPLTWSEVEAIFINSDPARSEFNSNQVLQRVEKHGDLFAEVLKLHQQLPNQQQTADKTAAYLQTTPTVKYEPTTISH